MKKIYLMFIMCFVSNFLLAQEYDGTMYFKDGTSKIGKIEIPKRMTAKNIVFNGNEVASEQILRMNVFINSVPFTFVYCNYGKYKFKKYKEFDEHFWYLKVDDIQGHRLEYFVTATKFKISKEGKLVMEAVGDPPMIMHMIKKIEDDTMILVMEDYGDAITIGIGRNKVLRNMIDDYLVDCDLLKNANVKELSVVDVVNIYNNCN
ncbi:hypothetical protein [Paenimyroides baculatum]|uniref:Uncharacterized protein n=1 Tax=Paenimyroides baculatum TaxID=2608000 RepID=A0A5M6CHH2_9FLAO|nr:hypothetical protein [Paenimyroides baculatum]KAA5532845.1 hypothetical protein F0460_13460 [Paenimyroides baculatum]